MQVNKNNRYKIRIFIVLLFILIVFTNGLAYSQTTSEVPKWLRKYVYLYELPNTSPKQVLLKIQSDFTWHSLFLTERGDYWYQLAPGSEQQFPVFAQAMLGIKVEYNEAPANIKTENRVFAFREAINAPKGFGPKVWGPLTMGYFVGRFQRAPFSTIFVDNITLELINITKIFNSKSPRPKKLLARFGLEKANATVTDFERMRQDKNLIRGEPAFQDAYFQQIQSWQIITKTTEPNVDMESANSMRVIPMIMGLLITVIILGFVGWLILYYKILSTVKQVTQSLAEIRGELRKNPQTLTGDIFDVAFETFSSQFKNDVAEMITSQSEKIIGLERNIVEMAEQLKDNQDTNTQHQMMLDMEEQAQQWKEFESKFRPLEGELRSIVDVISQLRVFVDEGILTQLEQFVDEGFLAQLEQIAQKLPLLDEEHVITEEEEITQALKHIELLEDIQKGFIDLDCYITAATIEEEFSAIVQKWEEFKRKFDSEREELLAIIQEEFGPLVNVANEFNSTADVINQLKSFVNEGVMIKLEQLPEKFQEAEAILQRLRDIDEKAKTTAEHLVKAVTLWWESGESHRPTGQFPEAGSTVQNDTPPLKLDINIEGEIRRGRDNPIVISFSNPNQFPVNVTDMRIDFTNLKIDLPLTIPPQEELRIEANFDASEVKEKKVEVSCHISCEGQGSAQEKEIQIELEATSEYEPFDFDI